MLGGIDIFGLAAERLDEVAFAVEQSDAARDRQTGNSVAVPCVEWITRRIVAADAALDGAA